ncbi:choline dehydrogenase-like flavoprotein [Sinorhizobium medicae]|nr:GMC family oxidoreductase [Sinorhizobium medicae]MDX0009835.1 GMC family oxidoreductase [Sinorhizobium meliloti]MDX0227313.1 GMC family oxidoreductase [Sinorhizobium meliloti]TWA26378.1 choline dehydrogenase-like flavoprotein [Sinorhizobium medicae]
MSEQPDIVIIGSGMGGATLAAGLAGSGARIVILERGEAIVDTPQARDARAIFIDKHFRTTERWQVGKRRVRPSHYYCVGGNTKFYGAILIRYRREDFGEKQHFTGTSPAWPFSYETFEPWYSAAETLYAVRGTLDEDPTEPYHSIPYPHPPVPDEPDIARFRAELRGVGLHPASLPLGIDIDAWLQRGQDPWDAFPDTTGGKMDAQTRGLATALADSLISLETGARVDRLEVSPDGRRVAAVHYRQHGETKVLRPGLVVLSAGAINSAAILLRSGAIANSSDQVGRNYMNHNGAMMLVIDPRRRNRAVYQKTIHVNDFYFGDGANPRPLGNFQMVGKVSAPMLASATGYVPRGILSAVAQRSIDCFAMSEDLPDPESRVHVRGSDIALDWKRTNLPALTHLLTALKERLRACGYPIIFTQRYTEENSGHQCGTVRMGNDPAKAPLDPYCRAYDQPNLFVVDASFLPNSAAVNPSLTVAAQALRVADHIRKTDLGGTYNDAMLAPTQAMPKFLPNT